MRDTRGIATAVELKCEQNTYTVWFVVGWVGVTAHSPQGPDARGRSIRGLSMHGFLRLEGLS